MRKAHLSFSALALSAVLALSACGGASDDAASTDNSSATSSSASSSTVTVEDNFGTQEISTPPTKVAVTDNRSFEILDSWGVEPVAAPLQLVPSTLDSLKNNENVVDIGNHREPDLEALAAAEPELIINGQRFQQYYEDIKELNPDATLVELEPREGEPMIDELKRQTTTLGEIFGKQAEADQLVSDFDAAVERVKKAYDPSKKVMALNVSGGEIGYIAPGEGRFYGPLFDELGLTPALTLENGSDNHEGDDISVEAIADSNPDWILVLDRDAAVSQGENQASAESVVKENAALQNVTAIKEDNVVLAPADTYTNENIITYTEVLNAYAEALEKA